MKTVKTLRWLGVLTALSGLIVNDMTWLALLGYTGLAIVVWSIVLEIREEQGKHYTA